MANPLTYPNLEPLLRAKLGDNPFKRAVWPVWESVVGRVYRDAIEDLQEQLDCSQLEAVWLLHEASCLCAGGDT